MALISDGRKWIIWKWQKFDTKNFTI